MALTQQGSSSRWTEAVLKLTKLTREGRITWTRGTPPPKKTGEVSLSFFSEEVFVAEYDNQRLRFRRRVNTFNVIVSTSGHSYVLEIVDEKGETIWAFPTVEALADLYQAISYHQAGIGKFVDRLLSEP